MVLHDIQENFPDIFFPIDDDRAKRMNLCIFYNDNLKDLLILKELFPETRLQLITNQLIAFVGNINERCSLEIRITDDTYKFYLFKGSEMMKSSSIYRY